MLKDAKYEDFSVASQYAETPFTKQLVTTFKGNLTPLLPLSFHLKRKSARI